ncbi:MAG TPA: VapC toxin family PIN domain ribonuclease [Pseudonocardiaceae bacterium]|nr:VapC toxin family PIN domain ribonuclease [Pseudonocardiaceae bacterium]
MANSVIALNATHEPVHLRLGGTPITVEDVQGALIRLLIRRGVRPDQALRQLGIIAAQPRHEFWPDEVPFTDVALTGVLGPRQVTDAYLAALARSRTGRLATFDKGLAQLHTDVAHLVPTG